MFDDLFGEPTYSDIVVDIDIQRTKANVLDDDTLVDEIGTLRYHLEGKDFEKLEYIIAKNYADEDLDTGDRYFLENLYIISNCMFAILVDEDDEEDDE